MPLSHIRGRVGRNIYPARQNQMSVVTYDIVGRNGQQSQHWVLRHVATWRHARSDLWTNNEMI